MDFNVTQKWPWLHWLQRHRLTRSCGLVEGAMVVLVTQIYQVLPFGRRGPGCSGYKDADLPGPAIWQKGPWLPWLQRHRLTRSCDLAEGAMVALGAGADSALSVPAPHAGPLSSTGAGGKAAHAVDHVVQADRWNQSTTVCQQHCQSTAQSVNNTARSTTQPVNNTAKSTTRLSITQPVKNKSCQAANNRACQQHSQSTTQPRLELQLAT